MGKDSEVSEFMIRMHVVIVTERVVSVSGTSVGSWSRSIGRF